MIRGFRSWPLQQRGDKLPGMADPANEQLEIGHVLFIDIVGYSKLLIEDQKERLHQLTEVVLQTPQVREATDEQLVRLPTGDGMALVFRHSAAEPARCALEVAQALKKHPAIPVRMGIHSGPVSEVTDVSGRTNIAGAGINMAQRVMDCGDAGHILLSQRAADDLSQYREWAPRLHDLGECEVKHGVRLHLVNLCTDQLGNPETPEKLRSAKPVSTTATLPVSKPEVVRPARGSATGLVITALLVAGAGYYFFTHRPGSRGSGAMKIPEKSIAVLPFENLSRDPDNAYFTEGVQDEILTRLAKVADLKVISRTSTERFKSSPENLPEIARQLGVAHILEGSVQKSNNQVRVNVQLIKAATDAHLWAETFDRKLNDIFTVESEIAKTVADTLRVKLTGSEKIQLAKKPTTNEEAYELYLKGRFFWSKRTAPDLRKSIEYFNQAIAKDPDYALAYAMLAQAWLLLPNYEGGAPKDCAPPAEAAIQKALALDQTSSEAHTALGYLRASFQFNFSAARTEYERALQLNPNDATAHHWLAFDVLTPLGESAQAVAEMRRALELDPLSLIINEVLGGALMRAGRLDEAIVQLRKTIEMDAGFPNAHRTLGQALERKGQLAEAMAEYQRAVALSKDPAGLALLGHLSGTIGRKEEATKILNQLRATRERQYLDPYNLAIVYLGLGNREQALTALEQSYDDRNGAKLQYIRINPFLDPLRGDPRFEALAEKIVPASEFAKASPASK
jgi:TolB-like protein/Flp pilus assembly protein TadD/class 3 adenylate cyclase